MPLRRRATHHRDVDAAPGVEPRGGVFRAASPPARLTTAHAIDALHRTRAPSCTSAPACRCRFLSEVSRGNGRSGWWRRGVDRRERRGASSTAALRLRPVLLMRLSSTSWRPSPMCTEPSRKSCAPFAALASQKKARGASGLSVSGCPFFDFVVEAHAGTSSATTASAAKRAARPRRTTASPR